MNSHECSSFCPNLCGAFSAACEIHTAINKYKSKKNIKRSQRIAYAILLVSEGYQGFWAHSTLILKDIASATNIELLYAVKSQFFSPEHQSGPSGPKVISRESIAGMMHRGAMYL